MYSVYIKNFKRNNTVVTNEELMFSVPSANQFPCDRPVVKSSEDAADNFSFTMEASSPYYDALLPLKTLIRVEYDGDVIFSGRVLTPQTSTVYHTKNIICEGVFAYFNDTFYEGVQEKQRGKISLDDYYTRIINNHNTMAPAKTITRGTVGVTLPSDTDKYEPTAWTQTSSLISNLASNYGGHMTIRYSNGTPYLDWYKYYARDLGDGNRPKVVIGKNILDISSDFNIDNVFTYVIPIGDSDKNGKPIYVDGYSYTDKNNVTHTYSGKAVPVSIVRDLYTDQQLTDDFHTPSDYSDAENTYGVIYKTMSFSDATTQAKLWDYTKKWIKNCYFPGAQSFSVKAIDMHIQDPNAPKILIGDCVDVTYLIMINGTPTWVTKKLVCKIIQYDLFNPDNNTYTFGIPSDLLEHDKNNRKKSSQANTSSGATAGSRAIPKGDEEGSLTWRKVWRTIGDSGEDGVYCGLDPYISFGNNGELFGTMKCYDPEDPSDVFTARLVGKITIQNLSTKWVCVSEDKGIFAVVISDETGVSALKVVHWYSKHKGYKYEGSEPAISRFEEIARMIETDPDSSYGGSTNAGQFRDNGQISGSVNCYDPDETSSPSTHPEFVFKAQIVGKFGSAGSIKYVAMSNEYGIFAYTHSAYPDQVRHWYVRAKGIAHEDVKALITEEKTGEVFSTRDSTPDGYKTIEMKTTEEVTDDHGNVTSVGQLFVGLDTFSQAHKLKVRLNDKIQFTDEHGIVQQKDGFVAAEDLNLPDVDSFKTKLIVTDSIIAGKVDATEITAELAYIRDISSDQVTATRYVSAGHIKGTYLQVTNNATFDAAIRIRDVNDTQYNNVGRCFNGLMFTENNGVITLTLSRVDGSQSGSDSFNMASTSFYQNAVEAAHNDGGKTAYFTASRTGQMDPGQSMTLTAYYIDADNVAKRPNTPSGSGKYIDLTVSARSLRLRTPQAAQRPGTSNVTITPGNDTGGVPYDGLAQVVVEGDADLVAGNIKKDVTIFGVTGTYEGSGGSLVNDNIQIHDYGSASTGTPAPTMKAGILQAIDRGSYFSFEVYVQNTDIKKTYYMNFGS